MGLFGGSKETSPRSKADLPAASQKSQEPSAAALLEVRIKELEFKLREQEKSTNDRIRDARDEVTQARSEFAEAEKKWRMEKDQLSSTTKELEGERQNLLRIVDELKTPVKPVIKPPLFVEITIANVLFSRPFHFFIEAELHGVKDNTEVAEISECPSFVRSLVFRVKENAESSEISVSSPAVVLSAKAFIDEVTSKLLGTARILLEPQFYDASDIQTPSSVQFVRNAAVYGKCVVNLRYFRSANATLSEPIKLEKPLPSGFQGVPVVHPVASDAEQYIKVEGEGEANGQKGVTKLVRGEKLEDLEHLEMVTFQMKSELREKHAGLAAGTAGCLSLSEEVISELSSLSNLELRDRLLDAVQRYKTERTRLLEMRREIDCVNAEKKALEAERQELVGRLETLKRAPRVADDGKYRETIQEQEKVIGKLETIIETSVKKIQSAESMRAELERLRVENKKLRNNAELQMSGDHYDDGLLRERVSALETQLIAAAKKHARELAELKLAQFWCCVF